MSPKRQRKFYKCATCGVDFQLQSNNDSKWNCIDCRQANAKQKREKLMGTPLKELYLSAKLYHPQYKMNLVRKYCRKWNEERAEAGCQVCGYKKHIEFAHIKPLASFSEDATVGEVNSPENVLVLCRNHHWEFDNDALTEPFIPTPGFEPGFPA